MQIAVTSDIHISHNHPERLASLKRMISLLEKRGIYTLIISGDLLDNGERDYSLIDELMKDFRDTNLIIIPGNHDMTLSNRHFSQNNIFVIESPIIHEYETFSMIMLPYEENGTMGKSLASLEDKMPRNKRILLSHGDWGVSDYGNDPIHYYPLTNRDLTKYNIGHAILGHVHKPHDPMGNVSYTGSPYPIDHTEIGPRSYMLIDEYGNISREYFASEKLYYSGSILCIPGDNDHETGHIMSECEKLMRRWNLENIENGTSIAAYISVRGYSRQGKKSVSENIRRFMKNILVKEVSSENLKITGKCDYEEFYYKAAEMLESYNILSDSNICPSKDDITECILNIIYG